MKIRELFEEKEVNLIGKIINGIEITEQTQNSSWNKWFACKNMQLTSLKGSPKEILGGQFACSFNKLTSLKYSPEQVQLYFECSNNKLTSIEFVPKIIGSYLDCENNQITSLKNIHKYIDKMDGSLYFDRNPIKSHVLGVLLVNGCSFIELSNTKIQEILNKYLRQNKGREALYDCQEELINAGFEEYAQL